MALNLTRLKNKHQKIYHRYHHLVPVNRSVVKNTSLSPWLDTKKGWLDYMSQWQEWNRRQTQKQVWPEWNINENNQQQVINREIFNTDWWDWQQIDPVYQPWWDANLSFWLPLVEEFQDNDLTFKNLPARWQSQYLKTINPINERCRLDWLIWGPLYLNWIIKKIDNQD